MSIGPLWGTKGWRILTIVIAVLLLAWGILTMVTDFLAGYQQWWYNSTVIFFALALFGLVLLVKEGKDAFNNISKYGLHPDRSGWISVDDPPESVDTQTDFIRTYDEPE